MTLITLSFVFGAILILAGIIGGGFEVKELKVPRISGTSRVMALVAGLAFIVVAFNMSQTAKNGNTGKTDGKTAGQDGNVDTERRRDPRGRDRSDNGKPGVVMSEMELNTNRPGLDLVSHMLPKDDPAICRDYCRDDPRCRAWTYVKPGIQGPEPRCWLKSSVPPPFPDGNCVSGTKIQ
jgi:hypothetical protein